MNDYKHAFAGGMDTQQFLTRQVNLFLFDLKNEAKEHGFSIEDSWALQLVTDQEIESLKLNHHPIVSLSLGPDALLNAFQQVKGKLQQSLSKHEIELTISDLIRDDIKQMAAYPAREERK